MTEPRLRIEVLGSDIIVTLPGTSLADYPGISASHNIQDERDASITRAEFLALAWRVANDKARELGWIV